MILKRNAVGFWVDNRDTFESCWKWLHEFCSPYKQKRVNVGRRFLREKKTAECRKRSRNFVQCKL